jgi:hypothetical protein
MALGRIDRTSSFSAKDDAGNAYVVYVYTQDFDAEPTDLSPPPSSGMQFLKTADGRGVDWESKGVYRTVAGLRLTSDDPSAP